MARLKTAILLKMKPRVRIRVAPAGVLREGCSRRLSPRDAVLCNREHKHQQAEMPTTRKIRVECEGTIDKRDHGADILAKIA